MENSTEIFVLINSKLGKDSSLMAYLKTLPTVKDVYRVFGVYDLVAHVSANTMEEAKETVARKIRRAEDVVSAVSLVTVNFYSNGNKN